MQVSVSVSGSFFGLPSLVAFTRILSFRGFFFPLLVTLTWTGTFVNAPQAEPVSEGTCPSVAPLTTGWPVRLCLEHLGRLGSVWLGQSAMLKVHVSSHLPSAPLGVASHAGSPSRQLT